MRGIKIVFQKEMKRVFKDKKMIFSLFYPAGDPDGWSLWIDGISCRTDGSGCSAA